MLSFYSIFIFIENVNMIHKRTTFLCYLYLLIVFTGKRNKGSAMLLSHQEEIVTSERIHFINLINSITVLRNKCNLIKNGIHLIERVYSTGNVTVSNMHAFLTLMKHQDCASLYEAGYHTSGVYSIWLTTGYRFLPIYCDMDTPSVHSNKRGWMVIQRRFNGQLDFDRNWQEYVDGFGSPFGEYWLGLENIYQLARYDAIKFRNLRFDLMDWMEFIGFAEYTEFLLHDKQQNYRPRMLSNTFSPKLYNNFIDSYLLHFSTKDRNNQHIKELHDCANEMGGGWWHNSDCSTPNLNGPYPKTNSTMSKTNIYWRKWKSVNPANAALTRVSIKIL